MNILRSSVKDYDFLSELTQVFVSDERTADIINYNNFFGNRTLFETFTVRLICYQHNYKRNNYKLFLLDNYVKKVYTVDVNLFTFKYNEIRDKNFEFFFDKILEYFPSIPRINLESIKEYENDFIEFCTTNLSKSGDFDLFTHVLRLLAHNKILILSDK